MKKLYQYTMILLAGVLGACSSMSVSDPYSDSFPADFDVNVYMALHPELRILQVKDYVSNQNAATEAAWAQQGLDAATLKAKDEAAFKTNTTALASIYANPYLGGYNAAGWETDQADSTVLADLLAFNFIGTTEDLTELQNIPVNEFLISQQYIMFGQSHGWAYRLCTEAEAADLVNHPDRKTLKIDSLQRASATAEKAADAMKFVADTNLYCRDAAGADRVIQ